MKMAPATGSNGREVEAGDGAPKLRLVAACFEGGLFGLFALSTAITLAVTVPPPPPGLRRDAYLLALTGLFFAGLTQVVTSVWAADDGRRLACGGASRLHPLVVCFDGWLLDLFALSTAITIAVSVPPPPGLDMGAYMLALTGLFFAGVTQVVASVWAADDGRRLAAGRKFVNASLVVPLLAAVGISVASLLQ